MNEFMKIILEDRINELRAQGIEDPIAYLGAEAEEARKRSFECTDQETDPKKFARERIERQLAASENYKQETIKPTKANLNRVLIWSSSRINEWRKSDVVAHIQSATKRGEDFISHYVAGVYSAAWHGYGSYSGSRRSSGGNYTVLVLDGKAYLLDDTREIRYHLSIKFS